MRFTVADTKTLSSLLLVIVSICVIITTTRTAVAGAEPVSFVTVFYVKDGDTRSLRLAESDLTAQPRISVDGYVCGIIACCDQAMDIRLGAQKVCAIPRTPEAAQSSEHLPGGVDKDRYFLFSEVTGSPLSAQRVLEMSFERQGNRLPVTIEQETYGTISTVDLGNDLASSAQSARQVVFRAAGIDQSRLKRNIPDLSERLHAFAQGIAAVESTFGVTLVENVNIINYKGIRNAVTRDGAKDIWLYLEALELEPVRELRIMAQHECFHRLVDVLGISANHDVRRRFADLRGFDDFSYERFLTVTTGRIPAAAAESSNEAELFFSFVDERHFLEGMKGGHSRADLDEFCASFLHSLMFAEHFEANLERPVFLSASSESRFLTKTERDRITDAYVQTMDVFLTALARKIARRPESSPLALAIPASLSRRVEQNRETEAP